MSRNSRFLRPYLCTDESPTIETVDTSNVPAQQKPVITTLTRIFNETSEALGDSPNFIWKRQLKINSENLGELFDQLNSGGISKNVADKLVQLCQALDNGDFGTEMLVTSNNLGRLETVRRLILTRQTIINGPEAMKLFEKRMGYLDPPQDVSNRPECRTVDVDTGGCSEQDLRDKFNAHGEIESLRMLAGGAAHITYTTREGAEKAAKNCLSWWR